MKRLDGKVILVAGGGGIGDGVAHRYAAEGAAVVIGDIALDRAEDTAQAIVKAGGEARAISLDGAEEHSIEAAVRFATDTYGGLGGLHANFAALNLLNDDTDVVDMDMAVFDGTMRVNTRGFFLCTRYALPALVAGGGGAIVYTSSGAAYDAQVDRVAYAMSKQAGHALMRHVATRYGPQGVRANAIAPGLIRHRGWDRWPPEVVAELERSGVDRMPIGRVGVPSDIASISTLLMSDEGSFITGQVICVDGGVIMRA